MEANPEPPFDTLPDMLLQRVLAWEAAGCQGHHPA